MLKRNPRSLPATPQIPAQLPVCAPFAATTTNIVRTGVFAIDHSAFSPPAKEMHGLPPSASAESVGFERVLLLGMLPPVLTSMDELDATRLTQPVTAFELSSRIVSRSPASHQ